jgi:hypothetical protein
LTTRLRENQPSECGKGTGEKRWPEQDPSEDLTDDGWDADPITQLSKQACRAEQDRD